MNSHIELVKRYLAGEAVTTEELRANSVAADAADVKASAAADVAWAAARAAHAADNATRADAADARADAGDAAYYVKLYEGLNK